VTPSAIRKKIKDDKKNLYKMITTIVIDEVSMVLRLASAVTIHKSQGKTFEKAIRNRQDLEIVYLKAKDEKSHRQVRPIFIGEMEYNGRPFTGFKDYCLTRREERTFNVDRILEIRSLPG
jgi:predicted DNA-binding transcriptional regulator YafY